MMEPSPYIGNIVSFQEQYLWLLIVGCLTAALMAYGIGANDVANAFATSVGSKSITFKQAVVLGTICETVGATFLGAAVSDAVRKNILDLNYFKYNPEVLMLGMVIALFASGLWLIMCSSVGLPVSTTHSIIGAIIGVGLATSPESVQWDSVGYVVLSWVASPLCSAVIAALFFITIRKFILRHENGQKRALLFYPVLLFFLFSTLMLCFVYKIPAEAVKEARKKRLGLVLGSGFAVVVGVTLLVFLATFRFMQKRIAAAEETDRKLESANDIENCDVKTTSSAAHTDSEPDPKSDVADPTSQNASNNKKPMCSWLSLNKNIHETVEDDSETKALHDDSEKFTERTEVAFNFLQVISACFDSVAHGSNDVANAVGPFVAVLNIFREATIASKVQVDWWILICGGAGISLGLITYGSHVLKTMGVKMAKITPSRGFCIEMGATWVIIIGSNVGMPLSTTHCQVGATMGVGLCESRGKKVKGIQWGVFGKIAVGWITTLVFTAALSMVLYSGAAAAMFPRSASLPCSGSYKRFTTSLSQNVPGLNTAAYEGSRNETVTRFRDAFNSDSPLSLDELVNRKLISAEEMKLAESWGYPTNMNLTKYMAFRCVDPPSATLDEPCAPLCLDRSRTSQAECAWMRRPDGEQRGYTLEATYQFKPCVE
eukprot:GEMP01005752.1.p1 GENE.GEMP01005752.1~~GEMP01005752.1.p1  ORF type:complete len:659 (+),score=163.32 GEMP01005752.1:190-2166(+)